MPSRSLGKFTGLIGAYRVEELNTDRYVLLETKLIWPIELWRGDVASLVSIPLNFWAWGGWAGLLCARVLVLCVGLQQAPASLAAMFLNLIPIFGVTCAYLVLGERLTLAQ